MNQDVGFEFPIDVADEWSGFNDPGMEHFSGNPYVHVGKEVPQNTLDALRELPAKLKFELIQVPIESIPGIDELKATMQYCLRDATKESAKAHGFFEEASRLLSNQTIHILLVSDTNTTGIIGPSRKGQPFHAFMKATGQSKKSSDTGLGSYGIGKFAPFTISKVRTLFVSTVWEDGKDLTHYVQGKSILMSHEDDSGAIRNAVGYWGVRDKCQPVVGPNTLIPTWLERAELGTTLAIIGFDPIPGWQDLLAASVAQNFFGAISDKRLVATIGDIQLDAESLAEFLERESVLELVRENQKDPEEFREAGLFLSALTDEDQVFVENTENLHLGNCELRIRVKEGLPKRVAVLRDGMFITSELNQLKRFSDFKDFVAVVRCKSDKGNRLLRAMEPPRHDDFEPHRLLDPEEQRKGKVALREIGKWVRDMLKRHARDPVSEETEIDELTDYFADEAETSDGKAPRDGEVDPRGRIIVRARPIKRPTFRSTSGDEVPGSGGIGSEGGHDFDPSGNDGGGTDNRGDSGAGRGSKARTSAEAVTLLDVRAVPLSSKERRVTFSTDYDGLISLHIQASGADTNQPLDVASATQGNISRGLIKDIPVKRGYRSCIDIKLSRPFNGTIRVIAYAV